MQAVSASRDPLVFNHWLAAPSFALLLILARRAGVYEPTRWGAVRAARV